MCPDKACEAEDCPKCVTICKPPHCVTHCQVEKINLLLIENNRGKYIKNQLILIKISKNNLNNLYFLKSPKPVCEAVCDEPNCDWKCHKPECPKPKCELVCENPGCKPSLECCKCEDHFTHLEIAVPMFKQVENDPRCCPCDRR